MAMTAQSVGLIMGVVVFSCTVLATFLLLIFGGSFKRMREQVGAALCNLANSSFARLL